MKKVKVGPITYKIVEKKRLTNDNEDTKIDGSANYTHCKIRLDKRLGKQTKRLTLWHEIVHCILVQNSITEHDETMINALAYGIINVLQDNPELRKK